MTRRYLESLGVEYIPDAMYTNKDLGKVINFYKRGDKNVNK